MLLTAISILGFYLPPESGERIGLQITILLTFMVFKRIGLQITILLTFMVFILTVGDMFPASTGPYLGVYFVLCMALLGLNIIMTVLVLHLHHIPCKLILMVDPTTVGYFNKYDLTYTVFFISLYDKPYPCLFILLRRRRHGRR